MTAFRHFHSLRPRTLTVASPDSVQARRMLLTAEHGLPSIRWKVRLIFLSDDW
jgi:hypothetical protein